MLGGSSKSQNLVNYFYQYLSGPKSDSLGCMYFLVTNLSRWLGLMRYPQGANSGEAQKRMLCLANTHTSDLLPVIAVVCHWSEMTERGYIYEMATNFGPCHHHHCCGDAVGCRACGARRALGASGLAQQSWL